MRVSYCDIIPAILKKKSQLKLFPYGKNIKSLKYLISGHKIYLLAITNFMCNLEIYLSITTINCK